MLETIHQCQIVQEMASNTSQPSRAGVVSNISEPNRAGDGEQYIYKARYVAPFISIKEVCSTNASHEVNCNNK